MNPKAAQTAEDATDLIGWILNHGRVCTTAKKCNLIENADFWNRLDAMVQDIEPICYGMNINQSDKTCLDQVVLTMAGIFLHFSGHPKQNVADGMKKQIEKHWKGLDQPMFIFALILNPYERLDRFGDQAGANVFVLNTQLTEVSTI